MDPPPLPPPSAPAPLPMRSSRATLANVIGWPAVAVLGVGYLILIARLTSFPFEDFPDHLARAAVMADLLFHHGERWGAIFSFHWTLVPYLLPDLLLTSLVAALGTTAGGLVFLELTVLALPCALLYSMHVNRLAPQARPLVVLVSLYLATDWFFLVGFAAFRFAVPLIIVCLALADALRQRWSGRLYAVYLAAVFAGYLDHLTVLAFLAAALTMSAAVRIAFGRASAREEMRLLLPVLLLLALFLAVLAGPHHAASPGVYTLDWGTVSQKLTRLQNEFFRYGGRSDRPMILLLAFSLFWPVRRELPSRRLLEPAVLEQLALAVTFLGIYAVLPGTYSGAAYVDVRALPMVVIFVLFAVLRLAPAGARANGFGGAPALAAAAVLAGVNLGYVGWHLLRDNAWMQRYRQVAAAVPRGSVVLPVYTFPPTGVPLEHGSSFVLLDRQGLIPYLFAGNRGDPMSYFSFRRHPYAPVAQWYLLQRQWDRAPVFTFRNQGESYRWRFRYDKYEHDWKPAVLAPVSWSRIACDYSYILVTEPYDPAYIRVPTRPVTANASAALLAIDRGGCPAATAAPAPPRIPPQVTY